MLIFDWVYLFGVTLGLVVCYFLFYYFVYFYHTDKFPAKPGSQSVISVAIIIGFSLVVYAISYRLPGFVSGFGNRVIHTFGGGFLAFMMCYFVAKDTKLKVNKIKYSVFCFMLVITLGVFNEIAEAIMQNVFHFTSAPTINDTWFDLISNTVGAILGIICFIPFLNPKNK